MYVIVALLLLAVVYGPRMWADYVLKRYDREEYFSGTGLEFARLLLRKANMEHVRVEVSPLGDHFNPLEKVVRLNDKRANRRSLTAVVIAAHEVGHAIQDHTGYPPLVLRTRLAILAAGVERVGAGLMMVLPLVAVVTRVPFLGVVMAGAGASSLVAPLIVHLVTLPVELDASFKRALPILETGEFIPPEDMGPAGRILTACALTYVAGALAGLFNVWRWIRILRR